MLNLHCRECVL